MIILNFHGVGPVTRAVDAGERNCWLEVAAFEAVLDAVQGRPGVRLTVDDGNASDHTYILPALQRRGLKADFFLCSGRIGQPTFLTHDQVADLRAQGMGIGSHGVAHRPWRDLAPAEQDEEIAGSKAALEQLCGAPVDAAACPFGSYSRPVLTRLRRAGYRTVYTSDGGAARDGAWLQARTTITRETTVAEVDRLVRSGPGMARQGVISAKTLVKRLRS